MNSLLESAQAVAVEPLLAGFIYLAIWVIAVHIPQLVQRLAPSNRSASMQRFTETSGWRFLTSIIGLAYTIGFLHQSIEIGYIESSAIGLIPLDWASVASWLPLVTGIASVFATILWAGYWWQRQSSVDHSPRAQYGTILGVLAHIVAEELRAAIFRGALIPTLGLYWGAWGAWTIKGAMPWASPGVRDQRASDAGRAFLYLDYAIGALATACFVVSGNLWASLIARTVGHLTTNVVYWAIHRRSYRSQVTRLPDHAAS